MSEENRFDLAVVGAGPGGTRAAELAAKKGLSVVLFEKDRTGGTCLNVGCIPTKYLLGAAHDLERIRSMTAAGMLRGSGEFSFRAIQRGKDAAVERLRRGEESALDALGVKRISGSAKLLPGKRIECGGTFYSAKNVIIATGSEPVRLNVPGAELMTDSTGMLSPSKVPARLTVIGAGVIGLEFASLYASFNSAVTVVEAVDALFPADLPEAASLLRHELEARGIRFIFGAKAEKLEKTAEGLVLSINTGSERITVTSDALLCAVGRRPVCDCVTEGCGVEFDRRGGVITDEKMRTKADGIYAVGDVRGGTMLAHAAYADAQIAIADITGEGALPDTNAIPRCVYTDPGYASVGLTPAAAKEKGFDPVLKKTPFSALGMAHASRDTRGACFAVTDKKSGACLGFFLVGTGVHELIDVCAFAVSNGWKREDWERHIAAHPTLSEMIRDTALR